MLICVLSLCCGGVAADVRYDFALLPLYGGRLVTDTYFSCMFTLEGNGQSSLLQVNSYSDGAR